MNKNKNLFDLAMGWYSSGEPGKKAAALDLFPEEMLQKEIEAYRKRDKEERFKSREENLKKMLERCKKLFPVGTLVYSDDGTDKLPNLTIGEPYIKKVEFLPFCVDYSWEYDGHEKKTIMVDTVRIRRNEPYNYGYVCLETLLYYLDKSKDDNFRRPVFIDLKEYEKEQKEKRDKQIKQLKEDIDKGKLELEKNTLELSELEKYDPSELEERLRAILKLCTK